MALLFREETPHWQEHTERRTKRNGIRALSAVDYELGDLPEWDDAEEEEEYVEGDQSDESSSEEVRPPVEAKSHSMADLLERFNPEVEMPPHSNLEDVQLWLECDSQRESVLKYERTIQDARQRKDFASMSSVQRQVLNWYETLKDRIETEQLNYLSADKKTRKDMHSYGPYLCALQSEKIAVICSHQAMLAILSSGSNRIPVVTIALKIGTAIEAEVNVQRLLRQRMDASQRPEKDPKDEDKKESVDEHTDSVDIESKTDHGLSELKDTPMGLSKRWSYGASHLQQFIDESSRNEVGNKKTRIRIDRANQRALRLLNSSEEWPKTHKIKLGCTLVKFLLDDAKVRGEGNKQEDAFVYEKERKGHNKFMGVVGLNDQLYKLIMEDDVDVFSSMATHNRPMVIPPRDWTDPNDGGYCAVKVELMRTNGCRSQREALQESNLDSVYDGLNVLGKVPWVINKEILRVAHDCWENNIPLGDIPTQTNYNVPDQPIRPERQTDLVLDDKESETYKASVMEYKAYRESTRKFLRMKQKNMDLNSLRCSTMLKLNQADLFQDFENIYFPYNLDFRGRAYPIPPHLSNVGSDLSRGVLKFSKKKPLGPRGLYWLKVHLANLAGADKMSFEKRAEFTEKHMDSVRAAVMDPLGEDRWWTTLDDPFQGLATCHEIVNAIDSGDPATYEGSLPVHMDGSCNGLQHYAALGRDTIGGKAVNLCKADGPQDVYIGVMHEVIRRVAEEAKRELDFDHSNIDDLNPSDLAALRKNRAAKLVHGLIDRGVVKRTVMTSVYGVTFIGARQQIQEKITEKLEEKGADVDELTDEIYSACSYLAKETMEVMGELFVGARQTMNWLASCARLISQQGQPVAWISPIGVPAVQPYRQSRQFTVVTLLQSVVLTDNSDDLPLHSQRQVTAFPPNYVHSLDSSHMLLTALEMDRRGLTFSAVHDSFWTHPADIDEMNKVLRETFIELYDQPLLENLKRTWELRYPSLEFPELPERGTLNLEDVRDAPYFFQ